MSLFPDSYSKIRLVGKSAEFFAVDGIVLSNQKWTESHTHSSGVGSFHHTSIGIIALLQIKSYTIENQEVWLRLDDGKDIINIAIVNHSTGCWHTIGNLDWLVHSQFFRKQAWLTTFAIAISGWLFIGLVAGYAVTAGGTTIKSLVNSPPVQALFGVLIHILPTLPGVTDQGESLVVYMVFTAFVLILVPPVYALWRYVRRYFRFKHTVQILSTRLNQVAHSIL